MLYSWWQGSVAQYVDLPVRKRKILTPGELEERRRKVFYFVSSHLLNQSNQLVYKLHAREHVLLVLIKTSLL